MCTTSSRRIPCVDRQFYLRNLRDPCGDVQNRFDQTLCYTPCAIARGHVDSPKNGRVMNFLATVAPQPSDAHQLIAVKCPQNEVVCVAPLTRNSIYVDLH